MYILRINMSDGNQFSFPDLSENDLKEVKKTVQESTILELGNCMLIVANICSLTFNKMNY